MLRLADSPSHEVAHGLAELSAAHNWAHAPCFPRVPLATWATVVIRYCVDGYQGLIDLSKDEHYFGFVLGLLESLNSTQALEATIDIGKSVLQSPMNNPERSCEVAGVIGLIARNKDTLPKCETVRRFLHQILKQSSDEGHIGVALCALRYYGDETSLSIIEQLSPLLFPWEGIEAKVVRAIRKRIRESSKSLLH